jgi:serine/threonine-protein kinase
VGTAEFLSPEQASGKPVTNRSDLYSLGAVLYTLLVGHPPFQGRSTLDLMHKHRYSQFDPPQRLVPDIPHDLDRIVCGLLEKDPAHRPANGMVLLRQLETFEQKVLRREQRTMVSDKPHETQTTDEDGEEDGARVRPDNPGPATLMSQLVREELVQQQRGGPVMRWINRPIVLISLFVVCLNVIIWAIWFKPGPTDDYTPPAGPVSELEQLYRQGQRLYQRGYVRDARNHWSNMVEAFKNLETLSESDRKWVEQAEKSLREKPDLPTKEADDEKWKLVEKALAEARLLWVTGERAKADERWRALRVLYWNDPTISAKIDDRILLDRHE